MCEALRKVMADELAEATAKARTECHAYCVKALMENMNFSVDEAMEKLKIPNEEKETVRKALTG